MFTNSYNAILCQTENQVNDIQLMFKNKNHKKNTPIPEIKVIDRWLFNQFEEFIMIKFSDKNIYTGCTGLRRRQDSPAPTRRPSELTSGDLLTFGARVFYCSELRMACSQ